MKAEVNQLQVENHTLKDNEEEYKSKVQESKHDILLLERTLDAEKSRLSELQDHANVMANETKVKTQKFIAEKVTLRHDFQEVELKLKVQTLKSEESEKELLETVKRLHETEKQVKSLAESLAKTEEEITFVRDNSNKIIAKNNKSLKTRIEQMQQKLHQSEEQQSSLESMYSEAKLSLERSIMEQSSDNRIFRKRLIAYMI